MSSDTRPLLRILPWLLASAAAHAVLLINWPAGENISSANISQSDTLQVRLIRSIAAALPSEAKTSIATTIPVAAPATAPKDSRATLTVTQTTKRRTQAIQRETPPADAIASESAPVSATTTAKASETLTLAASEHSSDNNWAELMTLLHQAIDRNKRYPQSALRMGREGSARIDFQLGPDGHIEDLNVGASSGVHALDLAASRAVRDIAPFPAANRYLERTQRFQVDVVFRIN